MSSSVCSFVSWGSVFTTCPKGSTAVATAEFGAACAAAGCGLTKGLWGDLGGERLRMRGGSGLLGSVGVDGGCSVADWLASWSDLMFCSLWLKDFRRRLAAVDLPGESLHGDFSGGRLRIG